MGPYFNLEELWDAHLSFEFATRDVDATMSSMVAQPYVYVVPTMTGGFGYKELYHFYKHHFIFQSPDDIRSIPISRTIGADRVVDEHILCFTHSRVMDWILPGIAPTRKYVEIPLIAIVSFRGGKLYNEHIYWDQASVLAQVGLLDPKNLPIVGAECSQKLLNPSLPSNELIPDWSYRPDSDPSRESDPSAGPAGPVAGQVAQS
jgi:carboxymethylenebutenolidase